MSNLEMFMQPRSIAVIGASNDKTRIGGRPIRYLVEGGFVGSIYPVNPKRNEVQGLRAYPRVEDVSGPVDCAIIATPADAVLSAVRSCANKGVKGIVMLSAGFAELGEAGKRMQDEFLAIARAHDIRIIGPNCLGLFNTANNIYMTFSGVYEDVVGTSGRIGVVSQSGGYAGELVTLAKRVGLNFGSWITTGNEADVEAGEVINAFAEDDNIDVILAYLEGVRNRDTLIKGLEAAAAKHKPVIIIKSGRSGQGALAAAAHTASLAGADTVYDAIFERYGAYRARTTEEMLDVAYAASRGVFPSGKRLVVLTGSGGIGVLSADFGQDEGLELAQLPDEVKSGVLDMVPNAGMHNPIDLTAKLAHEPELFARALDLILASGKLDMAYINIGVLAGMPYAAKRLVDSLTAVAARYPHIPMGVGVMAGDETVSQYEDAGFLQYLEPARALKSLAALHHFSEIWSRDVSAFAPCDAAMPEIPGGKALSETEAKQYVAAAGIRVPEEFLVQDASAATKAATHIGQAVAIKVVSSDLLHKTEFGGVALGVAIADAGARVDEVRASVTSLAPHARIEGFLITPMISGGTECFVGTHVDPVFGVTVTFGLGGIAVELYRDVTTRVAPIDKAMALEMIRSTKGSALLEGYRGRPKADVEALADAILKIVGLAQENAEKISTIEINPLLVMNEGEGVLALDAVITE